MGAPFTKKRKGAQKGPNLKFGLGYRRNNAWKRALKGLPRNLICVSSTRLRLENEKPKGNVATYFMGPKMMS